MDAYLDGRKICLAPRDAIGIGGEAQVFIHNGRALKIFHDADPNWNQCRLAEWRRLRKIKIAKLMNFPKGLPLNVVAPEKSICNAAGEIIGYSMPLVQNAEALIMLSNPAFRRANISNEDVQKIFLNLLKMQNGVHAANVIIGDFNDLNVLFHDIDCFLIDADSMQFNSLPCVVATERFLDPRLYGRDYSARPTFDRQSDYYAFSVMLFQSLLFVHPYGGVHLNYPTLLRRAEAKISVFNSEIRYPKAAISLKVLPDDLLDYFYRTFDKGERKMLDAGLLENMRWTTCTSCGLIHGRANCPVCTVAAPAIKEAIIFHGACKAMRAFKTSGRIILAAMQNGRLKILHEENDCVKRENGERVILEKARGLRFSLLGDSTLVAKDDRVARVRAEKVEKIFETGRLGNAPVFDSNGNDFFTLSGDYLAKNNEKIIGQILPNQTWFKVGPTFGFGFYRIGRRTVYFVFDAERGGLDDTVKLPSINGKLIDAECLFSESQALFLTSREENGKIVNAMYLIDKNGRLLAKAESAADNSRMLKTIRGKALGGTNVLCSTDDGLLLCIAEGGKFVEAKLFSDTEPFVSEDSEIIPASDGVYVVGEKEVYLVRMS